MVSTSFLVISCRDYSVCCALGGHGLASNVKGPTQLSNSPATLGKTPKFQLRTNSKLRLQIPVHIPQTVSFPLDYVQESSVVRLAPPRQITNTASTVMKHDMFSHLQLLAKSNSSVLHELLALEGPDSALLRAYIHYMVAVNIWMTRSSECITGSPISPPTCRNVNVTSQPRAGVRDCDCDTRLG